MTIFDLDERDVLKYTGLSFREIRDLEMARSRMKEKMEKYKPFFSDMVTPENEFSYDDVIIRCYPKAYNAIWNLMTDAPNGGAFNRQDFSLCFSYYAYTHRPDLSLLHEMIHMHIFVMSEPEREECENQLRNKLFQRIPQLPECIEYCRGILKTVPQPSHNDLFLLKSIDIDLGKKYKLGQTFDYGLIYNLNPYYLKILHREERAAAQSI